MAFLHEQTPPVLHHDLKSDNVLLWPDGPMFLAKICDFGMSTGTHASTMRTSKTGMGAATLAYKGPEVFDDEFSTASEVYSIGAGDCFRHGAFCEEAVRLTSFIR